jgi:hypothetical protein
LKDGATLPDAGEEMQAFFQQVATFLEYLHLIGVHE